MRNNSEFKHVMIDLETLGTAPGCIVLSIGAVGFRLFDYGAEPRESLSDSEFHEIISIDSCVDAGLTKSQDTINWWNKQSGEARKTLLRAERLSGGGKQNLSAVLKRFNKWLLYYFKQPVRIWGNGANFDQPILRAAYTAAKVEPAWSSFNERCYRTLKTMRPDIRPCRVGVFHNALDDAKTQAAHASVILSTFKEIDMENF